MKKIDIKKYLALPLIVMATGSLMMVTGCNNDSAVEDAAEDVEDAAEEAADEVEDAVN